MNPNYGKYIRRVLAIGAAAFLSACASSDSVVKNYPDTATRNAPIAAPLSGPVEPAARVVGSYTVTAVNVTVPETLRVSEANRFYPGGDIVWREDPIGNRYEQVAKIMKDGISAGASDFQGARAVELDVIVHRFHALTEKARYTVGGVHAIQFDLRIRDAETGAVIEAPRTVVADFDALGGQAAIAAEARGVTQKVRIQQQLAHVIRQELGSAQGYVAQDLGFMGALNQL